MGEVWFKNFVGIRQSDFELLRVPNPSTEFCIHVTLRSIQTGTLLGSVLGPITSLLFRDVRSDAKSIRQQFVSGGVQGAVIGALIGPVITYASLHNMSSVQLYDRCYRLRFNGQQLWLDRSSVLAATVGALSNGSLGFVVGIDLAVILSNILGRSWN